MKAREFAISFKSSGALLHGMLHLPAVRHKSPGVVICHGYFQSNRIGPLALYVTLARSIAEKGIACLRFDCAGFGESEGDYASASYESLVRDLHAAIRYLRMENRVTPKSIGILGHSLGGNLAMQVAADDPSIHALCLLSPNPYRSAKDVTIFSGSQIAAFKRHGTVLRKGIPASAKVYDPIHDGITIRNARRVHAHTLLVFGSADPYYKRAQYNEFSHAFQHPAKVSGILRADHNFLPLSSRPPLYRLVAPWFSNAFSCAPPLGRRK